MEHKAKTANKMIFRPWDSEEKKTQETLSEPYPKEQDVNVCDQSDTTEANFKTIKSNQSDVTSNLPVPNSNLPISKVSHIPPDFATLMRQQTIHRPQQLFSLFGYQQRPIIDAAQHKMTQPVLPPSSKSSYGSYSNDAINHGFRFLSSSAPNSVLNFSNLLAYNLANFQNSCLSSSQAHLESLMQQKDSYSAMSALTMGSCAKQMSSDQQSLLEKQSKKQRPKRFQCPHCQVSFSNNGQLKGHIRIHTGERPFECDHPNCGKTFTRNEELTRHKRIHTGLRPFACSICNKRFGRKDHLKKHVKTHQRPPPIPIALPLDPSLTYSALAYPWL